MTQSELDKSIENGAPVNEDLIQALAKQMPNNRIATKDK